MNRNYLYPIDSRRSPYPRRRRDLHPRSPELAKSLPAITLLSPESYHFQDSSYHIQDTMSPRPLSPGAFRMAPPRSAKSKMRSFAILNENLHSPVSSRPPSPSGRVSPFRGHGFKSPATSRPASRSPSPAQKTTRKNETVRPAVQIIHKDIGLPPKSPKRILKNVQIKEAKPLNPKPPLKPKPLILKNKKVVELQNETNKKVKIAGNAKSVVMSTVGTKKDKKSPVPPKKNVSGKKEDKTTESAAVANSTLDPSGELEQAEVLKSALESNAAESKDEPKVVSSEVDSKGEQPQASIKHENDEKLIPCLQPDKCYIVSPTMASPSQTATSTTTVPATNTAKVASASLSSISSALSITDSLSRKSMAVRSHGNERLKSPVPPKSPVVVNTPSPKVGSQHADIETVRATMTTVDEIIKSRVDSAASRKSADKLSLESPSLSERTRSSMVTVRAVSNGSLREQGDTKIDIENGHTGEAISSTKIIQSGPDFEVLSPNNLRQSPNHNMREPLWNGDRVPNGDSPSSNPPVGRCRRILAAIIRLLTYIFCCSTCCKPGAGRLNCCSRLKCNSCCQCCRRPQKTEEKKPCCKCSNCSPCCLPNCFSKLNCCNKLKCSSCCKSGCCKSGQCKKCSPCCKKLKCCEGKPKKSSNSAKMPCCAKPKCNSKECCENMKECCLNCRDRINNCCRSLFCLNFLCCQRCLKKCTCCHKSSCCKKGGCCSCCNPYVKREQRLRLDKKTSRASNQSKQERAKLDSALVEHASMMKAAIPVLPSCFAWLCLLLNIFIPGSGTLVSGILCLCFGKPRFSVNDSPQNRVSSFFVNIVIAISQAFTIIFCLVGWGWSIWWGVIMVKLASTSTTMNKVEMNYQQSVGEWGQFIAGHVNSYTIDNPHNNDFPSGILGNVERKQKRLKLAEKNQEGAATTAQNHVVDPERMQ